MDKDKKKTLTISSNLKKKIDTTSITTSGKKSFSVEKKKPFKSNKTFSKSSTNPNANINPDLKKKILLENLLNNKPLKILLKKTINPQVKVNLNSKDP